MRRSIRRWVLGLGWVALSISGAHAVEFFFDDFEGYFDSGELTSVGGWNIVEENAPLETGALWVLAFEGGRGRPGTENGTPSLGNYVLSDSDASGGFDEQCTGMSHDIWTPSFSCAGSATVWLHFDCTALLNNNGVVVFDVDVSTNGGGTWTNVFRRVAPSRVEACPPTVAADNTDGFVGRLDIDISAQAGNQGDVMVRVRQFEPEDDWWIGIDNVVVDDVPPVSGGSKTLLRREDFNPGQLIPGSWTILSLSVPENTGKLTWGTEDPCKRSAARWNGGTLPYQDGQGAHRLDSAFAILESEGCPGKTAVAVDDYLITPPLDCSNATEVFLHYRDEIVFGSGLREVLLSLDGGDTFEPEQLFNYNAGAGILGEDTLYAERVFLVPGAAGVNGVAFAFHFQSPAKEGWWAVDAIQVTANGAALPADLPLTCGNRRFRSSSYNEAANSITCFWDSLPGDQVFRVLRNGTNVSGDLPAATLTFTDGPIPAGTFSVAYTFQSVVNGSVAMECTSMEVSPLVCPENLVCCVDPGTQTVNLSWKAGLNIAGTAWRITRNGVPRSTVPLTATTFSDTVPAPGEYRYELSLNGGDAGQCPDLPLRCRARVSVGNPANIFFDDFEDYTDDADLNGACWEVHEVNSPVENAAWTITNPGGRGNPPLANGTASLGQFLISDSDFADNNDGQGTGRSHDIWSPPFSCAGKSTVWLHMDAVFVPNNNGVCMFDVDVSTDNGTSWTNAFRRIAPFRTAAPRPLADIPAGLPGGLQVGNADGFFGQLDLDLSPHAANKPNVRIRLRHFEPEDDWWIAIDDVFVDSSTVAGGARVVLPREGFAAGIPAAWTVGSNAGGLAPWTAIDTCNASLLHLNAGQFYPQGDPSFPDGADGRRIHHLDNEFALVHLDADCIGQAQDESLITPALDCSTATQVYLHFKSAIVVTTSVAEVLLSLDGGQNFNVEDPVFSYHREAGLLRDGGNPDMFYNEHIIEVPAAAGEQGVAFAFHYLGAAPVAAGWAIDDVRVTANGGGPVFHRGDADGSGKIDITDGIFILAFLFQGGPGPGCLEAANTSDEPRLAITSAIYILSWLFQGGPAPPDPGPPKLGDENLPCGPDPQGSPSDLGCISYTKC